MFETCVRAVRSLITSSAASSLFALPAATRRSASLERGVDALHQGERGQRDDLDVVVSLADPAGGRDNGGVVDRGYEREKPFAFTGTVKNVVFDIKPHLSDQDELELQTAEHHGQAAHGLSA
jgi:hypothetical protein